MYLTGKRLVSVMKMAPFFRAVAALASLLMSGSSKQVLLANTTSPSLQSQTSGFNASPWMNFTSALVADVVVFVAVICCVIVGGDVGNSCCGCVD